MLKLLCSGSDRRIYSVLVLLTLPGLASATTWHVTFDPALPEDRVAAIAAQAASGDSILIDPGTYYEHIRTPRKLHRGVFRDSRGLPHFDDVP